MTSTEGPPPRAAGDWVARRSGGCGVHTRSSIKLFNVEMESALFALGAQGLGAGGRVCWCWGAWVWPDWRAISGLLGGQHALVCHPGRLQALLVGAALDPSHHPSHTPFEHKLWELGSRGVPGPSCRGVDPTQPLRAQSRAPLPMPPQTQCLTGARKSPAPSGRFRVALNIRVSLRSACPPSVHPVSAGVSGCLPVAAAGLSPRRQPRC